jgi:cytochrome c oxidase subunit II
MMSSLLSSLLARGSEGVAEAAATGAEAAGEVAAWARELPDQYGTYWMPQTASTVAEEVDWLFYGILGLTIFWFVVITAAVVYFCIKYRARPGHAPEPSASHNDALEITWTIVPSIIVVIIFVLSWRSYVNIITPPQNAMEIQVQARAWSWQFTHKGGLSSDELHVPVNQPVKLVMTSSDFLHSMFIPAFRVKMDVLPRRYTHVWFEATKPGIYRLYCAEYCGKDHSRMKTRVIVHRPGGYEQYLAELDALQDTMDPKELGRQLYTGRGCIACHSIDGTPMVGPTFKGVFGTTQQMVDGSSATVDENYLRESIVDPMAKIRAGYQPVMPPFAGQLSDRELTGLIEFIKSLE